MKRLNIGIDVSKSKLDICILCEKSVLETLEILNDELSIQGFLNHIKKTYKSSKFYFGYESTSNYTIELKKAISLHDYLQIEINPYKMSLFLKHLDTRNKTDKIDALGIAKYIATLSDDDFKTNFNQKHLEFKKIIATLKHLEKIYTQLKNFQASQKGISLPQIDKQIEELKQKIKEIKDKIKAFSCEIMYKILPPLTQIKQDIKGVGDILLLNLTPYFLDFGKYSIKQIICHVGLTPRKFQSGLSVDKKEILSKQGNAQVRKILYMNCVSALGFMSHLIRAVFKKFEILTCEKFA